MNREDIFLRLGNVCLKLSVVLLVGLLQSSTLVGWQGEVDSRIPARASVWGKSEESFLKKAESLQEALKDPQRQAEAKAELRKMATFELVTNLGERILEDGITSDESDRILTALYALDEQGLPAVASIIRATESGKLVGKLPTSRVTQFEFILRQHPEAWEVLIPLTKDKNPTVRAWAIGVGNYLIESQPGMAKVWLEFVRDKNRSDEDRAAAIRGIADAKQLDAAAVDQFIEIITTGDQALKWAAESALASHPVDSLDPLIERLPHESELGQLALLSCLTRMGQPARNAEEAIRATLSSHSSDIRLAAARACWTCLGEVEPAIEVLKVELRERPNATALQLAGDLGPQAAPLSKLLADMLLASRSDGSYDVLIPRALGEIGPPASLYEDSLFECLDDQPIKWFCEVVWACTRVSANPEQAMRKLQQRMQSCLDERLASEAARSLSAGEETDVPRIDGDLRLLVRISKRIGQPSAPISEVLAKIVIEWSEISYRNLPLNAMVEIGPDALPSLENLATRNELGDRTRQAVQRAIKQIKDKSQ